MKLYNTLGRKLEEFKPIEPGKVKMYTCGPTVYDYTQIGNLRTFVFYDTLRRALVASGFDVDHVMNITDVGHLTSDADEGEDKLEAGAKREGKTARQVAELYTESFLSDMKELNVLPPKYAKATDYIESQIELVKLLVDKGFAYKTERAIYFDVAKLPDYGKLTGQKLDEKEVAARQEVTTDKNKRNPQDFAVWFFTVGKYASHEMRWDSPWGEGFPGWHVECSAIVHKTLGEPIDIHAGGVDLIGTHHTNEIAQTEAAYGRKLANYWLHAEHLMIDGQKMSKSAGNFYRLQDIKDKGYDPMALRLLFLQSNYRSQTNFTWQALAAASQALHDIQAWSDLRYQSNLDVMSGELNEDDKFIDILKSHIFEDLNTPAALSEIFKLMLRSQPRRLSDNEYGKLLEFIDSVFALKLTDRKDITTEQKELIEAREQARHSKDFDRADELRQKLLEQRIEINDTPRGPIWSRV